MVLLGKGKLVYEAVNDRGYPITKGRLGNNVKTFMKVLIEMLGR